MQNDDIVSVFDSYLTPFILPDFCPSLQTYLHLSKQEENDPSKIVSLYVMGEYEELNDLVRDGSKKLRDSKTLSDETILMYNRPRQLPNGMHPMQGVSSYSTGGNNNNMVLSPNTSYHDPNSPSNLSTSSSNLRKRVFGSGDRPRGRYKQVPRSGAPPKLKSHPRDNRSVISGRSYRSTNSNVSMQQQQDAGMFNCNPTSPARHSQTPNGDAATHASGAHHHFQPQCNFFPVHGAGDWAEALGFSVNSLWNCGANGGHLSPTMTPASNPGSPRNSSGGGQVGQSSGHATPAGHHPGTPAAGYHHHQGSGYHHHHSSGYYGSQNSPYRGDVEGRNPSSGGGYGYGRGSSSMGVRDTVVM